MCRSTSASGLDHGSWPRVFELPSLQGSADQLPRRPHVTQQAVKPELFPIVDADGMAKPIVLVHVESLLAAGITDVYIIVQVQ